MDYTFSKKARITAFLLLIFIAILFLNNSRGRALGANSGNTGAPEDNGITCAGCHLGGRAVKVDIVIRDDNGNLVEEYIAERKYEVTVTIDGVGWFPQGYGFQMVALLDNLQDVPTWSNPDYKVNIASANGRTYAEHSSPSPFGEFIVDWLSPEPGSGPVTFYAAGTGVNRNNASSGDGADSTHLVMRESTTTSLVDGAIRLDVGFILYPNPAENALYIKKPESFRSTVNIQVFDQKGVGYKIEPSNTKMDEMLELDISNLPQGVYWIKLEDGKKVQMNSFMKIGRL